MTQTTHGIVGIFDALGAKNFGSEQVASYMNSQSEILKIVGDKASQQAEARNIATPKLFTFNDTIIIALETDLTDEYNAVKGFAWIVRRFLSYSLTKTLFFRGAFSIGSYVVSESQNLIMGNAVADAASWYEQTELIGAVATPRASMMIQKHFLHDANAPPEFLLFETDIPCKKGARKLFAVNWPKAFYVPKERPENCSPGREFACLLDLLAANEVPIGTEHKYSNTIEFFKSAPIQKTLPEGNLTNR